MDTYGRQIQGLSSRLRGMGIRHLAADSYYSKRKFVAAVCGEALDLIGKLRVDAQLAWTYTGPYAGRGRPRKYAGNVDLQADLERFDAHGTLDDGVQVYSQVVWVRACKPSAPGITSHSARSGACSRPSMWGFCSACSKPR